MSRVFAIADLHLSLSDPGKSMDIFPGWDRYVERLEAGWRETVSEEDVVVVGGDLSWGMDLEGAKRDLAFVNALPGRKLLLKGNHDYWGTTRTKMEAFFEACGFSTLSVLHNSSLETDAFWICGTRGWMFEENAPENAKVAAREAQRLELSLRSTGDTVKERVAFLHYPPVYGGSVAHDMVEVLLRYGVARCYYGHIHSRSAHSYALNGRYEGVEMSLIAADYLRFIPQRIPAL